MIVADDKRLLVKQLKIKQKIENGRYLGMLFGTLSASLLRNL